MKFRQTSGVKLHLSHTFHGTSTGGTFLRPSLCDKILGMTRKTLTFILCAIIPMMYCTGKSEEKTLTSLLATLMVDTSAETADGESVLPPVLIPPGTPAEPGEPQEGPDLQDLTIIAFGAATGTTGLVQVQTVQFESPVSSGTTIALFLGRQNMTLEADGTVVNALKQQIGTAASPQSITWGVTSDLRYKILVVAKNEFGMDFKEVISGHPRKCANALPVPGVAGACGDHCIETSLNGNIMTVKAKFRAQNADYLRLDLGIASPSGLPVQPFGGVVGLTRTNDPMPQDYELTKTFDVTQSQYLCGRATSMKYEEVDGQFSSGVLVPFIFLQ